MFIKLIRFEKLIFNIKFTLTLSIMMKDGSQQKTRRLTRNEKKATSNSMGVEKECLKHKRC
jgi:hypothetical protein